MLPPVELTTPPARGVIRLSSGREARIVAVSTGDPWPPGTALEWLGAGMPAPQPATITTTAGGLSAAVWVLTAAGVEAVLEAPLARVLVDAGPPRIVARVRVDAGWTAGESTDSLLTDAVVGPAGIGIVGMEIVGGHLMVTLSDPAATVIDAGEVGGGAPTQDVYPFTVTAPLVIAPGMAGTVTPWPTDRTIGLLLTQDGVGGHTITYDESLTGIEGGPLPSVRTGPGESTLLILVPVGGGWWVGRAGDAAEADTRAAADTAETIARAAADAELQATIDGKAAAGHTHAYGTLTGLPSPFNVTGQGSILKLNASHASIGTHYANLVALTYTLIPVPINFTGISFYASSAATAGGVARVGIWTLANAVLTLVIDSGLMDTTTTGTKTVTGSWSLPAGIYWYGLVCQVAGCGAHSISNPSAPYATFAAGTSGSASGAMYASLPAGALQPTATFANGSFNASPAQINLTGVTYA